jgi:hypothetical protein
MNLKLNFKLELDLLTWAITQVTVNTLYQDDVYGTPTFFFFFLSERQILMLGLYNNKKIVFII